MGYVDAEMSPQARTGQIKLHGPEAFAGMQAAGQIAARCLDMLAGEVKDGVTTARLDTLARDFIFDLGAAPATLFYKGYRHSLCTSVNHVVCHGIPGPRQLRPGDIVNIDVTVVFHGWHGDTSRMYAVGPIKRKAQRLMDATYRGLMAGVAAVKPGARLGDVGAAIQREIEAERCSVVRDFCGHGLGQVFHDAPNVLHFGKRGEGEELRPGMLFTIEPMANLGGFHVKVLNDGWTAVTKDKTLSAQYEHSVGVTEDGVQVFTTSPDGLEQPHRLVSAAD